MADIRQAVDGTGVYEAYHGERPALHEIEVKGSEHFSVPVEDFIISPLIESAGMYLVSIHKGVEQERKIADLNPDEYTKIHGLIPCVELYLDTEETFYIKF